MGSDLQDALARSWTCPIQSQELRPVRARRFLEGWDACQLELRGRGVEDPLGLTSDQVELFKDHQLPAAAVVRPERKVRLSKLERIGEEGSVRIDWTSLATAQHESPR